MSVMHGLGQLGDQLRGYTGWLRSTVELLVEATTINELQRKEGPAVLFADFIDLHNVGMLEASHRLGFEAEPSQILRTSVGPAQDHFQGHQALEPDLTRLVHDAHAAPPQDTQQLVAAESLAAAGQGFASPH